MSPGSSRAACGQLCKAARAGLGCEWPSDAHPVPSRDKGSKDMAPWVSGPQGPQQPCTSALRWAIVRPPARGRGPPAGAHNTVTVSL